MRQTIRQQRPEIGLTCFVFDNQNWRRSDFLQTSIIWSNQQIFGLIAPDPICTSIYRSPLLPQKKITKYRCSFGHEFDGHHPPNGFLHIQIPTHKISKHLSFIEFDLEKNVCLLPDVSFQQQQDIFFGASIHIHPTFLVQK